MARQSRSVVRSVGGKEWFTGALPQGGAQSAAALRGGADALTFGLGDPVAASIHAMLQGGDLEGWRRRYDAQLAREKALDQYDARHRPAARMAGQTAGIVAGLAVGGGAGVAARLAGAARMTAAERAAWLAANGAVGAGMQTITDLAAGRRTSGRDGIAAAAGGLAAGAAARLTPGRAAAVGGAVTAATQDLLNGRPVSLQGVANGAMAGRLVGGAAGRLSKDWSNGLSRADKGKLGEALGAARSRVNGRPSGVQPQKQRDYLKDASGGFVDPKRKYWIPDRRDGDLRFEDKFGYAANTTPNQKLAAVVHGPNFQLNHFLPDDIGRLVGIPAGTTASHRPSDRSPRRKP